MSGPMNLVYPTPGDTIDTWGVALNAALTLVEQHDHTSGKGSLIRSSALGINADVSWASFALTAAKTITFTEQAPASIVGYSSALFASSADHNLYFRNSSGTNVQITAGATLNVSIVGGIGGDYASVSALFSYDDATRRYLAQQEGLPRPWAGFATGDIDLYQKAASISNKVTLKSPNALAASYAVTWLAALPAAAQALVIDSAGQMSAGSSFALAANANVTLSGTGTYKQGVKTKRTAIPQIATVVSSGGVTYGTTTCTLSNNSAVYFMVPAIGLHERYTAIEMWFSSVANAAACTCELYQTTGANPETGVTTTTSTFLTPGGTAVSTVTLSAQPTNAKSYLIKVSNSATTPALTAVGISWDTP